MEDSRGRYYEKKKGSRTWQSFESMKYKVLRRLSTSFNVLIKQGKNVYLHFSLYVFFSTIVNRK